MESGFFERRLECRQLLAEFQHRLMVEIEMLPPRQRPPRYKPLNIGRECRISPVALDDAAECGGSDDMLRPVGDISKSEVVLLAVLRKVHQFLPRLLLHRFESFDRQCPTGRTRQSA